MPHGKTFNLILQQARLYTSTDTTQFRGDNCSVSFHVEFWAQIIGLLNKTKIILLCGQYTTGKTHNALNYNIFLTTWLC